MKVLILYNREPYDQTDVTWNGLRLAEQLSEAGQEVRIFLMNDSVDMAREVCKPPEGYDQDLSQMLKVLIFYRTTPPIRTRAWFGGHSYSGLLRYFPNTPVDIGRSATASCK